MNKAVLKISLLVWSATLAWTGLSPIGGSWASFGDSEKSENNSFAAGSLDFRLTPTGFTKEPIPGGEVLARNVNILNGGEAFRYEVFSAELSGPLCDYVELEAGPRNGDAEYSGPLHDFRYGPVDSDGFDKWSFGVSFRPDVPEDLRNETCRFKIIFSGSRSSGDLPFGEGFTDEEEITDEVSFKRNGVVINEFLPDPEGDDEGKKPEGEWVELYNAGEDEVDVDGWMIYDSDDDHELVISSDNIDGDSTVIKPKKFLVVYRDGDGDFALNNSGGDAVRLYDGKISAGGNLIDSYVYGGKASKGKSFARIKDGSDGWVGPVPPTSGGKNGSEEEDAEPGRTVLKKEDSSRKADSEEAVAPEQEPEQADPPVVDGGAVPVADDDGSEDGVADSGADDAGLETGPEETVEEGEAGSETATEPDDQIGSADE